MFKLSYKLNKKFISIISSAIISVVLGGLFLTIVGRTVSSNITGVEENFYLRYYFSSINSIMFRDGGGVPNDDIVIFDVSKYPSRKQVAEILEKIYSCSPKVIALDIFYRDDSDVNDSIDNNLLQAIIKVQDKLVSPVIYSDETIVYPFFASNDSINRVSYALSLNNGFYDKYGNVHQSLPETLEITTPFTLSVAKKFFNDSLWVKENFRVNYVAKSFYVDTQLEEIEEKNYKDKIVIVGDCVDGKDIKNVPFTLDNNNTFIPGIKNIAYVVNSLITTKDSVDSFSDRYINMAIKDLPLSINIILSIVVVTLFIFFYDLLKRLLNQSSYLIQLLIVVLLPLSIIICGIILVIFSFVFTLSTCLIPDLFLCITSMILSSTVYEFVKHLKLKI